MARPCCLRTDRGACVAPAAPPQRALRRSIAVASRQKEHPGVSSAECSLSRGAALRSTWLRGPADHSKQTDRAHLMTQSRASRSELLIEDGEQRVADRAVPSPLVEVDHGHDGGLLLGQVPHLRLEAVDLAVVTP